jgi:hypothetical protein
MGLMDKMKETASKGADMAKGGAKAAQDKLEETKVKKQIDDLKEELGGVVYAQRTGSPNPTADATVDAAIDRLVNEIREHEAALAAIGEETDADDAGDDTADAGTEPEPAAPDA